VQDTEIKFGYAVTGEVATSAIWSNAGARAGDELLLTKAIGTGVISTALKFERAPAAAIDAAVASMTTLNRAAAEALRALPAGAVRGCTDITGFGLIGHATEMAAASRVTLEIASSAVPLIPGARALVAGNVPGGGRTNAQHFGPSASVAEDVAPDLVQLFYDPQTSGGLLASVAATDMAEALDRLRGNGVAAARIGRVTDFGGHAVVVR
jgi:selenide,water dikinase